MPDISVIVATRNRFGMWRRRLLWQSLCKQTHSPFELIVFDDQSTDHTLLELSLLRMEKHPFEMRVLVRKTPKSDIEKDSSIAENALFREARGELIVHLDDDGWIHPRMIEFVHAVCKEDQAFYGRTIFVGMNTLEPYEDALQDQRAIHLPFNETWGDLPGVQFWQASQLWAAPTKIVREIGGHDVRPELLASRGCDSRLGVRMANRVETWYFALDEFTFWHIGLPWTKQMILEGRKDEAMAVTKAPQLGNCPTDTVVNGGGSFFAGNAMDDVYEELK